MFQAKGRLRRVDSFLIVRTEKKTESFRARHSLHSLHVWTGRFFLLMGPPISIAAMLASDPPKVGVGQLGTTMSPAEMMAMVPEGEDDDDDDDNDSKHGEGSESDDNISLSEDSVYLRMTEHGTPRVVEEVYRRNPTAHEEADVVSVNKMFFTGTSRATNAEIFFKRDLATPAITGAIAVQAQLASSGMDVRARQTICSKLDKPGAEASPENDEEKVAAMKQRVKDLQATHSSVRVEILRRSHEQGFTSEWFVWVR